MVSLALVADRTMVLPPPNPVGPAVGPDPEEAAKAVAEAGIEACLVNRLDGKLKMIVIIITAICNQLRMQHCSGNSLTRLIVGLLSN